MALDPHKTALLVIDVQNEYFDCKWPIPDGSCRARCIETAIDTSSSRRVTVVYVQHAVLNQNGASSSPRLRWFENCTPPPSSYQHPLSVKNYPCSFTKPDLETLRQCCSIYRLSVYMTPVLCTTARKGFLVTLRALRNDAPLPEMAAATLGEIGSQRVCIVPPG